MSSEKEKYECLLDQMTVLMDQVREAKKKWLGSLKAGDLFIHSIHLFEFVSHGIKTNRVNAIRLSDRKEFTNMLVLGEEDSGDISTIPYNRKDHFLKIAQRIVASENSKDTDRQLEDCLSEIAPSYVINLAWRINTRRPSSTKTIHDHHDRPPIEESDAGKS